MKHTLECDGVYLEFGFSAILKSVYLKCETGEVVGLLGRNGSGKSCLMQVIFGTLATQSKSIRIDEAKVVPFTGHITYLPQDNFIPSYLSLSEALVLYAVPRTKVLDVFPELEHALHLKPSQLSGGLLRMFEVLLILNSKGKFCLLDEPFSGVMPLHVETLIDYIKMKKGEKGIIITDHLYRHITSISDRLYLLANGKTYPIQHENQLAELGYINAL